MTDHTITQDEINKYNSLSDLIKGLGEGRYNLNITNEINIIKNFTIDQTLNINAGGTLNINDNGTLNINVGWLIINGGTLNINSGGVLNINIGGINIYSKGIININSGGVLDISKGGINIYGKSIININDGGTIVFNDVGMISINNGTIDIKNGGTMNINNGGVISINGDGKINIVEGGMLNIDINSTLNINTGILNFVNDTLNYDKITYQGGQIICKDYLNDRMLLIPETKELQKILDVYNSVLSSFGAFNPSVESFEDYNVALFEQFKVLLDSELSDIEASDTIWPKQAITSQISKLKEEIKNLKYKNQLLLLLLTKSYNQQSKIQNNDLLKLMYKF